MQVHLIGVWTKYQNSKYTKRLLTYFLEFKKILNKQHLQKIALPCVFIFIGKTSLKFPKIRSNVYSNATNMKKVSNLKSDDSLATFWTHFGYKFGFTSELKISEGGVNQISTKACHGKIRKLKMIGWKGFSLVWLLWKYMALRAAFYSWSGFWTAGTANNKIWLPNYLDNCALKKLNPISLATILRIVDKMRWSRSSELHLRRRTTIPFTADSILRMRILSGQRPTPPKTDFCPLHCCTRFAHAQSSTTISKFVQKLYPML